MLRRTSIVALATGAVIGFGSWSFATVVTQTVGPYTVSYYNNGDSDGTDIGSQDWTTQQEADIASCIGTWTSRITNTPVRQVQLHMFWGSLGSGILGSSNNPIVGNGTNAYTRTEDVWRVGSDPGSGTDARIQYSSTAAGYGWNFGSGAPSGSTIDFRSVVTHEIGHCLGFTSSYQSSTDTFWSGGLTAMDKYLRDARTGGNAPQVGTSGTPGNFNQTANPCYFVGPNAEAANAGQAVAIYAPSSYTAGSTLSHVDLSTYPNDLMAPSITLGVAHRDPSLVDWGMIQDFGWTLAPVPEPGIIMFGATVVIPMLMRRQRREVSTAAG